MPVLAQAQLQVQPNISNPIMQQKHVSFGAKEEITNQKGMSKGTKWGLGLGLTALAGAGIYIATKGRAKNLNKLFNEKMVLSNLPEKIEFQEAKTIEDGIKYAKEVLKIQNVDEKFSLEAINYVNKSLVDVCNAHKGKLLMPQSLVFKNLRDGVLATANHSIATSKFAQLEVNSQFFEDKNLTDMIDRLLKIGDSVLFRINKDGEFCRSKMLRPTTELATLLEKYLLSKPMSIEEKRILNCSLSEMMSKIKTQGVSKEIKLGIVAPEQTIYHEMGHLQDYYTNLKNLTEANTTINKVKTALKTDGDIALDDINDRFLKKGNLDKKYKDNPNLLKEHYPTLYEHIHNQEIHDIAGKVSAYSQEGVGEFIAETYAKMIQGIKLDDDVMALYKKYGGPQLA